MNLLMPLVLSGATTEGVHMVPTKQYFKPVLVITAPLDRSHAALLGCEYLYDPSGNPVSFEGTHKLPGELPGAALALGGSLIAMYTVASEKVRGFGCFVVEKTGLRVRIRIHLPELNEDALVHLLQFLTTLNKEAFTVTITPAQKTLVDALVNTDDQGRLADRTEIDASHWHFGDSKTKMVAMVSAAEVNGGWNYGWFCRWSGKRKAEAKEELVRIQEVQPSEMAARDRALVELLSFVGGIEPSRGKEEAEVVNLRSWVFNISPDLARPDRTSAKQEAIQ